MILGNFLVMGWAGFALSGLSEVVVSKIGLVSGSYKDMRASLSNVIDQEDILSKKDDDSITIIQLRV